MDRVSEPRFTTTQSMRDAYDDPQLMSKYMPQYRPGVYYNFSNAQGFSTEQQPSVSEKEAKTALRIMIDFMKTETMKSQDLSYEPLLT